MAPCRTPSHLANELSFYLANVAQKCRKLQRRHRAKEPIPSTMPRRWNFTPSPGWDKEEVQILKLCLMKYGVGKWTDITNTGLLPGKTFNQLYAQTQRLVAQQSIAPFSGLHVDIDRIRADNEAK